jgi:4-carboxymuconolactone decarboxylase
MEESTMGSKADDAALGGRLPLLVPAELGAEQREVYKQLESARIADAATSGFQAQLSDGRLIGPFNAYLYVPQIADALIGWAAAIASVGLPADACQVAILVVGSAWRSNYEIYAHIAEARHVGVADEAISSIVAGDHPPGLSTAADVALRLARSLMTDHLVDDSLYAEAVSEFGITGLIALINLIGRYVTTAALLACFRVPSPTGGLS